MVTTCGVFVFDTTGKVLICRPTGIKTKDGWTIPKGKKEKEESEIEAAIRECEEETGLNLSDYKKKYKELGTCKYKSKKKKLWACVIQLNYQLYENDFFCKLKEDDKFPEINAFEMVDPEEALDRIHNTQSKLLKEYLKEKNGKTKF